MPILGLLNTEQFSSERFKNVRRSVFYQYPGGAAPLTGLLTMLKEEDVDDPVFQIYEKRWPTFTTETTNNNGSVGPFADNTNTAKSDPFTATANDIIRIAVDDAAYFRVGNEIEVRSVDLTSGTGTLTGVVTNVFTATTPERIEVRVLVTLANIKNGTTDENKDKEVAVIGSAFSQGASDISTGIYEQPINLENALQIFRTPFSITGSNLKTSLKYDETGPYKDMAKDASLRHMTEMEKAFIFGVKSGPYTDPVSGLPTFTTGGILWFLKEWEKADSPYRGGTGAAAVTLDTDDNKRIIENTAGTVSEAQYDGWVERAFRVTNNTTNEKLVLCGNGFLSTINRLYRSKTQLISELPMEDVYGMNVVKHVSPFGTLYYKTHPLFNQLTSLRYNALVIDVHNLVYRYMQGRDTELLTNRQPNDADYRKDEWLTECGLELRFPESCMYLKNFQSVAA